MNGTKTRNSIRGLVGAGVVAVTLTVGMAQSAAPAGAATLAAGPFPAPIGVATCVDGSRLPANSLPERSVTAPAPYVETRNGQRINLSTNLFRWNGQGWVWVATRQQAKVLGTWAGFIPALQTQTFHNLPAGYYKVGYSVQWFGVFEPTGVDNTKVIVGSFSFEASTYSTDRWVPNVRRIGTWPDGTPMVSDYSYWATPIASGSWCLL